MMADEIDRNVRWVLTFAEKTPQMAIQDATVTPSGAEYRVEASVANVGWMATATVHATEELDIAKPVRVWLELVNAELASGDPVVSLGVLPGTGGRAPDAHTVAWTVHINDSSRPARATLVVQSEKAGTVRWTLELPVDGTRRWE
jgi:hypothetical protein